MMGDKSYLQKRTTNQITRMIKNVNNATERIYVEQILLRE